MPKERSDAVQKARAILSGERTDAQPTEVLDLVYQLKREYKFDYARRVLNRIRPGIADDHPLRLKLGQQHAVCTYKDMDLPAGRRLDRAFRILCGVENPDDPDASQETLGIAGAIWKRRWEVTGRKQDLERSLGYYEAAAERGIAGDQGYTAVNAAFVLDLLAAEEDRCAGDSAAVQAGAMGRRAAAKAYRRKVLEALDKAREAGDPSATTWWVAATRAEAEFGLGNYAEADRILREALEQAPPEWERESTTQQFAALARLHCGESVEELDRSGAWQVVGRLVGSDPSGLRGQLVGKVGLALSGGGFRAALFHIGVLARLAELDLLRHVEVISCVSGGSIVGTHYYLKLKRLLETVPDGEITAEHYVRLVQDLERDFLAGVQRNIRTRIFAEWTTNLRMLFERGFTWTKRAGELFEEEIFSRMTGDGSVSERREMYMRDLLVRPTGETERFHPYRHNWRRRAKVPVLVLNATTLNTGHAWQFTATWMGEPPADVEEDHDVTYRLRRLYHDDAPEPYRSKSPVRLGHAVAASAAVPGLFDPVDLPGLYERRTKDKNEPVPIVVRLVDGGVHDNQGVASLTDQDCSVQLVSDASGQIEAQDQPKAGRISVLSRSASVQGSRVRLTQFDTLAATAPRSLDAPFVVHLKSGLGFEHIDWKECDEPYAQFGDFPIEARRPPTAEYRTFYRVRKSAQEMLAAVRTDLDSFSDAEAYALMLSGYRMTKDEVITSGLERVAASGPAGNWQFQRLGRALEVEPGDPLAKRIEAHLEVACKRFFKVWYTDPVLRALKWPLVGVAGFAAGFLAWRYRGVVVPIPRPTIGSLGVLLATIVAGWLGIGGIKRMLAIVNFQKTFVQYVISGVLAFGGFLVTRTHLWIFDRIFLRRGAIDWFDDAGKDREVPGAPAPVRAGAATGLAPTPERPVRTR